MSGGQSLWRRALATRLLSWLSGGFLALGVFFTITALEARILGPSEYGLPRPLHLINAAVFCAAWLTLRGPLGVGRIRASVASSATVVAVVVSLIAAFPAGYAQTRQMSYSAGMRADLRNLLMAEEAFFRDSGRYRATLPPGFRAGAGVTGPTIALTRSGWTASVSHPRARRSCVIYVGDVPRSPAREEGVPACTPPAMDPRFAFAVASLFAAAALCAGLAGFMERRRGRPS